MLRKEDKERYDKEDIKLMKSRIRDFLKQGYSYHESAKKVYEESPNIRFLTIRYHAYNIAKEEGFGDIGKKQHKESSEHGILLDEMKKKLEQQRFSVVDEQNKIRKILKFYGVKGNPDLFARRNDEFVFVEIVERTKTLKTLANQLDRYSIMGRTIVVFPFSIRNIEFIGRDQI